jgi:hypothetical protein
MSSADVVAGFNCAVGIFGGYPRVFTTDSHITKSNGGKMTLTCHGLLRSEDFPGRRCRVFSTTATRWQQVFTPSGEISLKCQVK